LDNNNIRMNTARIYARSSKKIINTLKVIKTKNRKAIESAIIKIILMHFTPLFASFLHTLNIILAASITNNSTEPTKKSKPCVYNVLRQ
jgi:hypothetical protein